MTYYLWKDKNSSANQSLYYITDYNEKNLEGKQKIDKYGFLDVELICTAINKETCISIAQMFQRYEK